MRLLQQLMLLLLLQQQRKLICLLLLLLLLWFALTVSRPPCLLLGASPCDMLPPILLLPYAGARAHARSCTRNTHTESRAGNEVTECVTRCVNEPDKVSWYDYAVIFSATIAIVGILHFLKWLSERRCKLARRKLRREKRRAARGTQDGERGRAHPVTATARPR